MIAQNQKKNYNKTYQSDMLNPNFSSIANAYGILSYKVTSVQQLEQVLKEIFVCKKAVLIDCQVV